MLNKSILKNVINRLFFRLENWLIIFSFLLGWNVLAIETSKEKVLSLSAEQIPNLILKQSKINEEIQIKYQIENLQAMRATLDDGWKLNLESSYEDDRNQIISNLNVRAFRFKNNLLLSKTYDSGTKIGIQKTFLNSPSQSLNSDSINNLGFLGLSVEQSLWKNLLGEIDQINLQIVEHKKQANQLKETMDQQKLILDGLNSFWNTYITQETYQQSLAIQQHYYRLVDSIKRNTQYGFALPGDIAQVQAELEIQKQNVLKMELLYLKNKDDLMQILNLPLETKLNLKVSKTLPSLPQLKENSLKITEARGYLLQKKNLEISKKLLEITKSQYKPNFSIIGQVSSTGLANQLDSNQQEILSFGQNRYYVGLKLSFDLEDRIKNEALLTQKKSEELESLNFEKIQMDLESQFKESYQKLQSTYEVAKSADAVIQFRKKAMDENQKNYKNGKIDTAPLIDSMNKYYLSQIEYLKSLGDYHIALNEWKLLQQVAL